MNKKEKIDFLKGIKKGTRSIRELYSLNIVIKVRGQGLKTQFLNKKTGKELTPDELEIFMESLKSKKY